MANYWSKRAFAELSTEADDLAKRGMVYLAAEFFNIGATSSVAFVLDTNGKSIQFEFYDIGSDLHPVKAELLEGASASFSPSASVVGRNLNRNVSDTHSATLHSASAWAGGTKIASELVGSGAKAGGQISQDKVHILKDNTRYVMVFYNTGSQTTACHLNLGWSEGEPDTYELIENVEN
jgi:hypothetical protein